MQRVRNRWMIHLTTTERNARQEKWNVEIMHLWQFSVTSIQSVIRLKKGPYENEYRHIVVIFFL